MQKNKSNQLEFRRVSCIMLRRAVHMIGMVYMTELDQLQFPMDMNVINYITSTFPRHFDVIETVKESL